MAAYQVVHGHRLVDRHLEAHDPLLAGGDAALDLVGGQRQRRGQLLAHFVVIGEGAACLLGLAAQCVQLVGRVEGVVGPAGVDQPAGVFQIYVAALALAVGGVGTSRADTLVDLDAAPFERFDDILLGSRHEPLRVGILDAQDHLAAVTACEEVVV